MYVCINFDKKMGRATLWATFLQTHRVTLIDNNQAPPLAAATGSFNLKSVRKLDRFVTAEVF
jgi:hypothetical protein